jgi:hypothetical protein
MSSITIAPIKRAQLTVQIVGTSILVMLQWSEKARRMIREKQAGRKTKEREVRDPEAECRSAMYLTEDGRHGVPAGALRACVVAAAHKDLGLEKTLVRKSFFIVCEDANNTLPIEADEPRMREDLVRVGMGSADLRYRPEYRNWRLKVHIEFDADLLRPEDILALLDRAGFGVGLCENRPEKGGDWGRFRVDQDFPITVSTEPRKAA